MILSTTHSLDNKPVKQYIGIISGEAIVGANIFKDIFASLRDFFGGRSRSYEKTLTRAKEIAIEDLTENARKSGAHGVIGITISYQSLGKSNSMLMVTASGTAVQF